jgi:hypothetical protein
MTCPQIYLGTGRSTGPLPDDYANDSIVPPTYYVQSGTPISVQVTVWNHGGDAAPATSLELYWTTPGTFVAPVNLINTYSFADGEIPGGITAGPDGMATPINFAWTPTTIGHFCLFARLKNTVNPSGPCLPQSYGVYAPPDDPLSGIHNVEVITGLGHNAPPPHRPWPMWFAFAAGNSFHGIEDTKLTVRVLDPAKDREKLQHLVAQKGIDRALSHRNLKFAVPNGVHVAEGRERIILPQSLLYRKPETHVCVPQMTHFGEVSPELAKHLTLPGSRLIEAAKGPIDIKLLPGEQRQTLVQVEPGDHDNAIYAVEVSHHGADGRSIGGLVLLFVPPHNYF